MSSETEDASAQRLVARIRAVFPAEAECIDVSLDESGFVVTEAASIWVEHFSQCTNDALKRGDLATFQAHLMLVSEALRDADEATRLCIDVEYVESLLWDVEDESARRLGWRLMPANLRALYVAMWGERPFMVEGA